VIFQGTRLLAPISFDKIFDGVPSHKYIGVMEAFYDGKNILDGET
jgi:hypothetical protein